MFYSAIALNKKGRDLYEDADLLHKKLWDGFPKTSQQEDAGSVSSFIGHHFGHQERRSKRANFLYIIQSMPDGYMVLMQSASKPNLDWIVGGIREMVISSKTTYQEPNFEEGQKLSYLIRFNPVDAKHKLGPAIPLFKDMMGKMCEIHSCTKKFSRIVRVQKAHVGQAAGTGEKSHFSVQQVDLFGELTVKNKEMLKEKVIQGAGRSKAYGCGLLIVKPA